MFIDPSSSSLWSIFFFFSFHLFFFFRCFFLFSLSFFSFSFCLFFCPSSSFPFFFFLICCLPHRESRWKVFFSSTFLSPASSSSTSIFSMATCISEPAGVYGRTPVLRLVSLLPHTSGRGTDRAIKSIPLRNSFHLLFIIEYCYHKVKHVLYSRWP